MGLVSPREELPGTGGPERALATLGRSPYVDLFLGTAAGVGGSLMAPYLVNRNDIEWVQVSLHLAEAADRPLVPWVVSLVPCVGPLLPCVVSLVPCVGPLLLCVVSLVPCVGPLLPCVGSPVPCAAPPVPCVVGPFRVKGRGTGSVNGA